MPDGISDAPTAPATGGSDKGVIIIGRKRYRTLGGLAELYDVSERTIRRWAPPTIVLGRSRLTDEDDLPEWMAGRKKGAGDASA